MVGLHAPMGPTRGQIVVTERTMPFLPHPLTTIRQTDEGTVMIGDSREEELDDRTLKHSISAVMADRAQRMFPHLARLNVVRSWAGIRVMPQDGFPIYDQSESHPGAFVACCHSGVTLASNHAFDVARMVAQGALEPELVGAFSARRFGGNGAAISGLGAAGVTTGTVTLHSEDQFAMSGANEGFLGFTDNALIGVSTTQAVQSIDISSRDGANLALLIADRAIKQVTKDRAELGAINNRLDTTVSNLTTVSENATAARSRIMDADFAMESANLSKNQVLQQAATSILAQANAGAQNVLSLLQG
jgi:flagellin-like hook-associated protein FlgL